MFAAQRTQESYQSANVGRKDKWAGLTGWT
jgi:hypothetical protein